MKLIPQKLEGWSYCTGWAKKRGHF